MGEISKYLKEKSIAHNESYQLLELLPNDLKVLLSITFIGAKFSDCYNMINNDYSDLPWDGDKPRSYIVQKDFNTIIREANLLGLLQKDPEAWFKGGASADEEAEFDAIALRRQEARAAKDWTAADAARDEATAKGIVLEDKPDGSTEWRKA